MSDLVNRSDGLDRAGVEAAAAAVEDMWVVQEDDGVVTYESLATAAITAYLAAATTTESPGEPDGTFRDARGALSHVATEPAEVTIRRIRDGAAPQGGDERVAHRILWNQRSKEVDEIVVSDCMAHLEELDEGMWYLALYPRSQPDERVMLNISGTIHVFEQIRWDEDEEHAALGATEDQSDAPG